MLASLALARTPGSLHVDSVRLARNGACVQLVLDLSIDAEHLRPQNVIVLTPRLVGAADSVDFPPVVAFGRHAYYHDVRQGTQPDGFSTDAFRIRYKYGPRAEHYARTIGHQPWMENSTLRLLISEGTPCDLVQTRVDEHAGFTLPPPDTTYVEHRNKEHDELTGSVSGQARIQFIVNRTDFNPDLRNNRQELQKMHESILEVQQNKNVRITKYRIKGYASPEGRYDNNTRLAEGRTERLRQFMVDEWGVPESQIEIAYEPEDWQGLRNYVVEHHDELRDADAVLDIVDSDLQPDPKLTRIAQRHPVTYKKLLEDCFPLLRRTDYQIDYDWLEIVERDGAVLRDTIITVHQPKLDDPLQPDILTVYRPTRPFMALKTNLLADAALTPNVEIELPLGRDSRWSLMVEDWFPWYLFRRNVAGSANKYRRVGHRPYQNAYELWVLGAEMRYWLLPRCRYARPTLYGTFIGLYAAGGKYDMEFRRHSGYQGEFTSLGLTLGRTWVLARKLNLELSASAGYIAGPRRHYVAESLFQDNRLIWRYSGKFRYWGPTKLKLSLVWLLSDKPSRKTAANKTPQKGGRP